MSYPVQPAPQSKHGSSIPQGWKIVLDEHGNPVYVRETSNGKTLVH